MTEYYLGGVVALMTMIAFIGLIIYFTYQTVTDKT